MLGVQAALGSLILAVLVQITVTSFMFGKAFEKLETVELGQKALLSSIYTNENASRDIRRLDQMDGMFLERLKRLEDWASGHSVGK